ncbi:MAG TPA: CotH kinase family protein [Solirubrobacterales bacterium]|nr:CotH kinase family protein [Solirubrobacterales bacterium]
MASDERIGRSRLGLGLLALLAIAFAAGPAAASADEAESMYATDAVVAIDLTLSETAIEELEAEPFEYVQGTFSLAQTDGTPAGIGTYSTPLQVGLRLKGNPGASFEDLEGKAAFKVKFDEYVDGQKFLGLEKMTLNNMVQDRSMLHETLAYGAFRDAGVPAPRTGYAFVRVNEEPYGLYLNLESLDVIALERIFGAPFQNPPQHLYEASYGYDLYPGEAAKFEVDEGKSKSRTDLEALIASVNSSEPESLVERVTPYADLEEMTAMWAVEKYIGHWDGYAGVELVAGPNLSRPNNYYLYSDPLGQFQMIPWGTDQTWEETIDFDARDGLLFDLCLEDPACLEMFRAAVIEVLQQFKDGDYEQRVAETADLLEPWQAIDPRKPHTQAEIANGVEDVEYFLEKRVPDAEEWLGIEPPPPPRPPVDQPLALPPPPAPEQGPRWRVGRAKVAGHSLRTRLSLAVPGLVTQTGRISTRRGTMTVCRGRAEVGRARSLNLRCELNAKARKRLENRRLKVSLTTRFDPVDGPVESATRVLTVPAG